MEGLPGNVTRRHRDCPGNSRETRPGHRGGFWPHSLRAGHDTHRQPARLKTFPAWHGSRMVCGAAGLVFHLIPSSPAQVPAIPDPKRTHLRCAPPKTIHLREGCVLEGKGAVAQWKATCPTCSRPHIPPQSVPPERQGDHQQE